MRLRQRDRIKAYLYALERLETRGVLKHEAEVLLDNGSKVRINLEVITTNLSSRRPVLTLVQPPKLQ